MAGCEFELLLDGCCIVVSLCLSSGGNRCGSFSFVAFESQVLRRFGYAILQAGQRESPACAWGIAACKNREA